MEAERSVGAKILTMREAEFWRKAILEEGKNQEVRMGDGCFVSFFILASCHPHMVASALEGRWGRDKIKTKSDLKQECIL